MKIIEEFTASRSAKRSNEDHYVVTPDFAAVIDGAGDPGGREWRGKSFGWHAARTVGEAVRELKPQAHPDEIVASLTMALRAQSQEMTGEGVSPPFPAANAILYSRWLRLIISVGDCNFRVGGEEFISPMKAFERVLVDVRRLIFHSGLSQDNPVSTLTADTKSVHDVLYKYQELCQNSVRRHPFSFPVLDGQPIHSSDIRLFEVGLDVAEIVLASDGYPRVLETLDQTEEQLRDVLAADPLLIGEYAQARAVAADHESFDDRTYLRINVTDSPG